MSSKPIRPRALPWSAPTAARRSKTWRRSFANMPRPSRLFRCGPSRTPACRALRAARLSTMSHPTKWQPSRGDTPSWAPVSSAAAAVQPPVTWRRWPRSSSRSHRIRLVWRQEKTRGTLCLAFCVCESGPVLDVRGNHEHNAGAFARCAIHLKRATQHLGAFLDQFQAEAARRPGCFRVKATAIVIHADADILVAHVDVHLDARGLAVARRIAEQLLDGTENHDLQVGLQPPLGSCHGQARVHARLLFECVN